VATRVGDEDLRAPAAFAAGAIIALSPSAAAGDGGSGTNIATGHSYAFALVNSGSTSWRSFYLVAPPGVSFVGGTTGNEASASCVVGRPGGSSAEIQCGPLSPSTVPPQGRIAFVATVTEASACGVSFELFVTSTDSGPWTRGADVGPAADCAAGSARVVQPPTLRGTATVGGRIRATPPVWSSPPTRVRYRWEICTAASCAAIRGAGGLTLVLVRREAGRAVRFVATATISGVQLRASSRPLRIRG
jgi:hypothetical protein